MNDTGKKKKQKSVMAGPTKKIQHNHADVKTVDARELAA